MSRRTERLNSLIRRDLSELLLTEIKDPRVSGVVSVTRVSTSADIQHAKVYVSVYGTEHEKRKTMDALRSASRFIRYHLRGRLRTRQVPNLRFILDDTLTEGNRMLDLIDSLVEDLPPEEPEDSAAPVRPEPAP